MTTIMKVAAIITIIVSSTFLVAFQPSLAKHELEDAGNRTIKNPSDWFHFGQGILDSCNSLSLVVVNPELNTFHRYALNRDSKSFNEVILWLKENVGDRMNSIPPKYEYRNTWPTALITLYASPEAANNFINNSQKTDQYLVTIPINNSVFGTSAPADRAELEKKFKDGQPLANR